MPAMLKVEVARHWNVSEPAGDYSTTVSARFLVRVSFRLLLVQLQAALDSSQQTHRCKV
jgi:hypothetical protein